MKFVYIFLLVSSVVFSAEPTLAETGGKCVIIPLTKLKKAEVIRLEGEKTHVNVWYCTFGKGCWRLKEHEFSLEFTGGGVSLILKDVSSKIIELVITRGYRTWIYVVNKPELDSSKETDPGQKCRAIA